MNCKIDLHTHSIVSYDGGITEAEYRALLDRGVLDCVAITDHNETSFARKMQDRFGDKIIVGEEITTTEGEIIGLFLRETIPAGLSAAKTVEAIRKQEGLVYIPHPFETQRKGLQREVVERIIESIDCFEVWNARGRFRGKTKESAQFAASHQFACAASSDAHGYQGVGSAFSLISAIPTKKNLSKLLQQGRMNKVYAPIWTYLYPAVNKLKKLV